MNRHLAYLFGAAGDATLHYRKDRAEYSIEYEQKNREWLENSIAPRVLRLLGKNAKVKKRKSGLFRLRFYSKGTYCRFKALRARPRPLLRLGRQGKIHFIRGFFDAEGSAPRRNGAVQYRIEIYQKDREMLGIVSEIIESLGIRTGKMTNSRDIGLLPIRRKENILSFRKIVSPEHPDKRKALDELCS